jgi:hypothetical protein
MAQLRFNSALFALILIFGIATVTNAQNEKAFPSDEEIGLLVVQADRTIQRYTPLLDEQETEIGKSVADEIAKERQAVNSLDTVMKTLKNRHSAFNGPLGFAFLEALHGAERNLLRCVSSASSGSTGYMIAGNRDKADALLRLSQSCMDVSLLIYTVTEDVATSYTHFIEAQDQWAARNAQAARKCENEMDKIRPRKLDRAY